MEFLKDIAFPQSLEHFHLLVFIAALSTIVMAPYVSFVLGSSVLSLWFNRSQHIRENKDFLKFSHELLNYALPNKSLIAFLAVLPGLSLVFTSAQMLQGTSSLGTSFEGFGFLFLATGMMFLWIYKYTFRMQGILDTYRHLVQQHSGQQGPEEAFASPTAQISSPFRAGRIGTVFLALAVVMYAAALSASTDPSTWNDDSMLSVLFSPGVWMKLCEFLLFSIGMTGFGILFFTFVWNHEGERTEGYSLLVYTWGIRLSMIGVLALPLAVLLNVVVVPDDAVSGMIYSLAGVSILAFFLAAHGLYGYQRSRQRNAISISCSLFLTALAMLAISDSLALGTATRHAALLQASNHTKTLEELESQFGVTAASATGEDIYNAKCFACHLFDQKKVGPPYQETIPKYMGKKLELAAFILDPVKKNSAYPPMPNQGLKPAEADSVANYIMQKVAQMAQHHE
jgi:cytochrome c